MSWERGLLRWNKKHFSSFLKGFLFEANKTIFLEGESPTLSFVVWVELWQQVEKSEF